MFTNRLLKFAAGLLFILSVSACGDNSNTNGTLTLLPLVVVASTNFNAVTASATLAVARPGVQLNGTPISFTATHSGIDPAGIIFTETLSAKDILTGSDGVGTWTFNISKKTFATTLQVTANTGGLFDTETTPIAP